MSFVYPKPATPTASPAPQIGGGAQFTTAAGGGGGDEFSGESAYEVLGVAETSSAAEIKASFRRLAKATHPDTAGAAADSHRFLQILAAYEILSDSKKRAHYDDYLIIQRNMLQKRPGRGSVMYTYNGSMMLRKQSEVVDWIQRYRLVIDDIISHKKIVEGSGYFANLESELYSAIRAAYFGPLIESMDFLPERFEAEERSTNETSEVKHMHWFQIEDKVATCECRCSRARLPPSKFWLFEPRCIMHDTGGWYIETFGRDMKGRTMPSQREWGSMIRYHERRLHPAMYLLALAYRTLDIEDAKRRKQTIRSVVEPKLRSVFRWCKNRF